MYQENNESIQWMKLILRLVIVLLVVLLSMKFIFIINNNKLGSKDTTFENNLKYIDKISKDYFNESNIPSSTGETKEYKISDILSSEQIEYMNKNYGYVDYKDSYIKVTRLDNEYQISTYISYDGNTNYVNSFVNIEKKETTTIIKTTKAKKVKTTTKKTTTKRKYKISFNTNGGKIINDIYVDANSKISIVPERNGYKFIGWYNDGKPFTKPVDNDYVLVAMWIKD